MNNVKYIEPKNKQMSLEVRDGTCEEEFTVPQSSAAAFSV
jgi:hypothetical protein